MHPNSLNKYTLIKSASLKYVIFFSQEKKYKKNRKTGKKNI